MTVTTVTYGAILLAAFAAGPALASSFTDKNEMINPFGSCALVKYEGSGHYNFWLDEEKPEDMGACHYPFPNVNIYTPEETVIGTYFQGPPFDSGFTSAPCPADITTYDGVNPAGNTTSFGCPNNCYDCASLCNAQASSVSKASQFYDPTLPSDACNAWVWCTNPEGCKHGEKVTPAFSCTLKRIPLDNPAIQKAMKERGTGKSVSVPEGIVSKGSSGKGSDFVSGLCNVKRTCMNTESVFDQCGGETGCGNTDMYSCWGYPMSCAEGCLPACPC